MIDEIFFDLFELPEPWQVYVFSRLCEHYGVDYKFGQYVSDSKMIVARVDGTSRKIEELNLQWEMVKKEDNIKNGLDGLMNHMIFLLKEAAKNGVSYNTFLEERLQKIAEGKNDES